MTDPFGLLLSLIRADAAVQAIASTRVGSEVAASLPCVVLADGAATRAPFGPGSQRIGMQAWIGRARCYAADDPTGAITARQLAGAVSDALHLAGTRSDATRLMLRAYAPDLDAMDRDPDTRWPFYDVSITAYLATEAIA